MMHILDQIYQKKKWIKPIELLTINSKSNIVEIKSLCEKMFFFVSWLYDNKYEINSRLEMSNTLSPRRLNEQLLSPFIID